MNDFYVGYLPKAPTALARFVRKIIIVLGVLAVTAALLLVVGQMPFANSAFEYGKVRGFEGVVVTRPFPTLLVARPGEVGQQDKYSRYLLVAPGKHGAEDLVASFDGKQVRLQGQLIYREPFFVVRRIVFEPVSDGHALLTAHRCLGEVVAMPQPSRTSGRRVAQPVLRASVGSTEATWFNRLRCVGTDAQGCGSLMVIAVI